jgi:hypothetical protein
MAYLIYNIANVAPDDFKSYFFDANTWIIALKLSRYSFEFHYEQDYADFFDAVINVASHTETKIKKNIKNQPSIVITSMLMSELINAYMRNIAMKMWFGGDNTYKSKKFKEDYRLDERSDYSRQLGNLTSDISAYKDYITILDDDFKNIEPFTLINSLANNCDFNDLYYYYRLLDLKIPIVTDDSDFVFQDIPIITRNPKLLKYSSL